MRLDFAAEARGGVMRGQPAKASKSEFSMRSKAGAEAGVFQKGSAT
jgi:hypothetical protein